MLFRKKKSGLYTMSGDQATPEPQKDLLTCHSAYIQHRILKDPSVNAQNHLMHSEESSEKDQIKKIG